MKERLIESLASHGFIRVPSEDFEDDGAWFRVFRYDPQNTGKSPFYFTRCVSRKYGTFFSIETSQDVVKYDTWRKFLDTKIDGQSIRRLLDKYNGVDSFGEKEQIDIVNTIEKVRRMPEFAKICPGFAVTNKEDASKPAKDFLDKDHKRMEDLKIRGNNDIIKMTKLAYNMAKAITDNDKYERRLQAAIDVYGKDSPIAKVFKSRSLDLFDNMRAFSESRIDDCEDVQFTNLDVTNLLLEMGLHFKRDSDGSRVIYSIDEDGVKNPEANLIISPYACTLISVHNEKWVSKSKEELKSDINEMLDRNSTLNHHMNESVEDTNVIFTDDSANDLIDKGIRSVEFTIGGKEYEIEVKNDVEGIVVFYDKENTQAFEFEDVMMNLPLLLAIRKFTKSRIYGKDIENVRVETWSYLD